MIDFLPKYPNINQNKYPILNPYDGDFYEAIFRKKEFYELKLDRIEAFPKGRGILTKYQKTIARYMSSHTPYDRLLLVHQMGLGKCILPETIVNNQKIEDIWNRYRSTSIFMDGEGEWSKPVSTLYVDSFNEKTEKMVKKEVSRLYRQYIHEPVRKIITQGGYSITTTKSHKILTNQGWTNYPENDQYIAVHRHRKEISFVKIIKIEEYLYEGWVYDLEIPDEHNYVANSIITHNTCSAIGAIEQIKGEESTFNGALILAKGEGILDNFTSELVEKCTPGYYIPENYTKLTNLEKVHRVKKKTDFYKLQTFVKFAKKVSKMSESDIIEMYSNKIIVIDEVHNLRPQEDKSDLETYKQFHRFLHLIQNSKVLFLSGTPMKDSPEEIASVSNLFLPLNDQFPTGQKFFDEFMIKKEGVYYVNPDKANIIKEKLKGKISFLREPESIIEKKFIGDINFGHLKHFIVAPNRMSLFQTERYKEAYEQDKEGKKGIYSNSREATLFIYPDGSYGKEGFDKYIKVIAKKDLPTGYKMSAELENVLRGKDEQESLKNIEKYSSTYAQVIEKILSTSGNCFIYSSLVQGSGCILFSLLLELFGFTRANGREKEQKMRYAILTNRTATFQDIHRITKRFNRKDNIHGKYIKVIIGSKTVSEGFSFNNIIFEAVNTPHWNYSEIAQALARGIRLGSHNDLIDSGENPKVSILQPVAMPRDNTLSIDLFLYKISEDKDIGIRSILRLLMECAFDCALNYMRNFVKGKDNSRECDYTICQYKCDGISDMSSDIDLDYSTYQLYYANPKIPLIRRKIEQLFREMNKIDMDSIIKNLNTQFTEEEIRNVLYIIQEESENNEFDYRTFLGVYSHSSVKKIMNKLEEMFKHTFQLSFNIIIENFQNNTEFEILSALQTIINDNFIIINEYGLPCYLREEKNIYFLVNSLSVRPNFYTEYYTKYPHIATDRNFSEIMNSMYSLSLPAIIEKIKEATNPKDFNKLMKSLPLVIQELFIEASLVAKDKNIVTDTRDKVLEFFKNYIKKIDNVWISTLLKDVLRCRDTGSEFENWKNCDEKYNKLVQEITIQKQQQIRKNNPYEIIGKYNPENDAFCIVDFLKEKQSKEKIVGKRTKGDVDKRIDYSGKVCRAGGWKLDELIYIAAIRLRIDPPKIFRKEEKTETMIERIKQDPLLINFLSDNSDREEVRRILYWGTPKKEKGKRSINLICEALRTWFEENNLLEIDNQCGIQGKKKIGVISPEEKKIERVFNIERFVPSIDKERLKIYTKDIVNLMEECSGVEKYKIPIDDNTWIMILSGKKLVGFITVDKNNILRNICIAKNYRRISKEAVKQAIQFVCDIKGTDPTLSVDNRNKNVKKLIRMYTSYGFEITKSDDRTTYMKCQCKI